MKLHQILGQLKHLPHTGSAPCNRKPRCSPSTRGDPPKGSDGCEPHRVAAIHHGCRSLLRPKGTVHGNLKTSGVTALPNIDVM